MMKGASYEMVYQSENQVKTCHRFFPDDHSDVIYRNNKLFGDAPDEQNARQFI